MQICVVNLFYLNMVIFEIFGGLKASEINQFSTLDAAKLHVESLKLATKHSSSISGYWLRPQPQVQ